MHAAETAEELKELARSRSPADRERLMLAIVELCGRADEAVRSPAIQTLLGSIFTDLVEGAEADIRRILAEKLAIADWPPPALVNLLALDEIEIARPIIAKSPVLKDNDLIRLLLEGAVEHQIEVAKRPLIGPPVVEFILEKAEPAVMIALAGNDTADVSPEAMMRMVEASRQVAGMRSPLARHPRLRQEMAERLYAWVGQSLRSAIVSRFRVDVEALDRALAEAVKEASDGSTRAGGAAAAAEQEEMERRLITKLHAADQLRPSYLLRALREGRLSLFEAALATLGDLPLEAVHRAACAEQPDMLALACAAVGLDRGAFSTLLGLVRELNQGRPGGDPNRARRVFDAFGADQQDKAKAAFAKAAHAV
ncbi:MAG TPA: DUF2336 domain-containing protein [Caulobacteraceae bacterium]|nr:DUF2336 domain-containing protein [Caulobacteraceae bacterium]